MTLRYRVFQILILGACLVPACRTLARSVDTREDVTRLLGFDDYLKQLEEFKNLRLSDKGQLEQELTRADRLRLNGIVEYRQEKRVFLSKEQGPEYQEYLGEKTSRFFGQEEARQEFINGRNRERAKSNNSVHLSEETELRIFDDSGRVDWKKRKLLETSKGSMASSGGNDTSVPRPPMPPSGPGYFEPPPPPPIPPYDGEYYDDMAPPPPPYYEEPPPPY